MYKIFVSHYSEEKPIAQAVHDLLEVTYSGFADVFISSDIAPGTDWLRDIKESLNGSDEVLSIFTYKSADRPWINIETGYGVMAEKVVTPVLFAGYTKADLPIIYHLRQAVDSRLENDVAALYNSILVRIQNKYPTVRPKWNQKEFWNQWNKRIPKAEALSPETPHRSSENPIVWLMGSHRHLVHKHEQQKALQVCQTLARAFMASRIQIVMGTSRMLEYLADEYVNYLEDPKRLAAAKGELWRKSLATEHAQSTKPAPNPIVLLGSLRKVSIRELFNDTIGRFPDIAILIGGRMPEQSGRAAEELTKAIEAEIPLLPIKFTGGAARTIEPSTHPSIKDKVEELQTLTGNVDRIGPLVVEIVERQSEIQRTKFIPRQI
jgi:hypothetical protein